MWRYVNETPIRYILACMDVISQKECQIRSTSVTCALNETNKTKKLHTLANWVLSETTHVVLMQCHFVWGHSSSKLVKWFLRYAFCHCWGHWLDMHQSVSWQPFWKNAKNITYVNFWFFCEYLFRTWKSITVQNLVLVAKSAQFDPICAISARLIGPQLIPH